MVQAIAVFAIGIFLVGAGMFFVAEDDDPSGLVGCVMWFIGILAYGQAFYWFGAGRGYEGSELLELHPLVVAVVAALLGFIGFSWGKKARDLYLKQPEPGNEAVFYQERTVERGRWWQFFATAPLVGFLALPIGAIFG